MTDVTPEALLSINVILAGSKVSLIEYKSVVQCKNKSNATLVVQTTVFYRLEKENKRRMENVSSEMV